MNITIESLATAIRADIDNDLTDTTTDALPTFRLISEMMHLAAADLRLTRPDPSTRYYFSDSTYDEITNAAHIITTCSAFIDAFYDMPDAADDAAIIELHESLDHLLYDSDASTIDDAIIALRRD